MTTATICLSDQLETWDPAFYNNLATLDNTADQLEKKTAGDGCLTPQNWQTLFEQQHVTQKDRINIFARFTLYKTVLKLGGQRESLIAWFGTNPNLSVASIIHKFNQLLAAKKISREDVPWMAHATISIFLQYKHSHPDRPLDVVFEQGAYDCSEYTQILQKICNAFGIENKAVVFWTGPNQGHAFLAYKISEKWGYASVKRFGNNAYQSLFEVCQAWEWKRHHGVYHFGIYQQEKYTAQGYYEI